VQPAVKQAALRFATFNSTQRPSQTLAKSMTSHPLSSYFPLSTPLAVAQLPNDRDTDDVVSITPTPSSHGHSVFCPSIKRDHKPAPLDFESLLLEEAGISGDDEFIKSASVSDSDEGEMDDKDMSQPQVMAGDVLWSPGMPNKSCASIDKIREMVMSPSKKSNFVRKDVTAPSPNDPFATFPSFVTAIEMGGVVTFA